MKFRSRDEAGPRSARELFHSTSHVYAGAAAVTGGAAGLAAGSLAGPLTAAIGGVLGAVIGGFAGHTFEKEERISGFHERFLDDEIGVTRGSLGVPLEAKQVDRTSLLDAEIEDTFRTGQEPAVPV